MKEVPPHYVENQKAFALGLWTELRLPLLELPNWFSSLLNLGFHLEK